MNIEKLQKFRERAGKVVLVTAVLVLVLQIIGQLFGIDEIAIVYTDIKNHYIGETNLPIVFSFVEALMLTSKWKPYKKLIGTVILIAIFIIIHIGIL